MVQLVSALMRNGPDYLRTLRTEVEAWMISERMELAGRNAWQHEFPKNSQSRCLRTRELSDECFSDLKGETHDSKQLDQAFP